MSEETATPETQAQVVVLALVAAGYRARAGTGRHAGMLGVHNVDPSERGKIVGLVRQYAHGFEVTHQMTSPRYLTVTLRLHS